MYIGYLFHHLSIRYEPCIRRREPCSRDAEATHESELEASPLDKMCTAGRESLIEKKYISMSGMLSLLDNVRHSFAGLFFTAFFTVLLPSSLHHAQAELVQKDKQNACLDQGGQGHSHPLQKK
jgi:hypothetical protein